MTGTFAWWSGNSFQANITATNGTWNVTIQELVVGGNTLYKTITGINMYKWLGCGTAPTYAPAVGTCLATFGMTAATGGYYSRNYFQAFTYKNLQPSATPTATSTSSPTGTATMTPSDTATSPRYGSSPRPSTMVPLRMTRS